MLFRFREESDLTKDTAERLRRKKVSTSSSSGISSSQSSGMNDAVSLSRLPVVSTAPPLQQSTTLCLSTPNVSHIDSGYDVLRRSMPQLGAAKVASSSDVYTLESNEHVESSEC